MKGKFNWRVFISFGLTWSLLIILVSGIVLYIAPAGRYANWVNWKILGYTREGWQSVHTIFSLTFVVLSVFHLFTINWSAFWSYIKSKTSSGINKKKELAISIIFTIVFLLGTSYTLPPFKNVNEFGKYMSGTWEKKEQAPPVAHAELLTIKELAVQSHFDVDKFSQKFTSNGIVFENTDKQLLKDIALKNNKTPEEIYRQVTKKSENEMPGAGIGRKTIENLAEETGKTVEEILKVLSDNQITAEKDQTIKQIGDNNNMAPRDVMELLK